jgi:hypothetical protein
MQQSFKVGDNIPNHGKIESLKFNNLFDFNYIVNGDNFDKKQLSKAFIADRENINKRLVYLFQYSPETAFKFLKKIIFKIHNLPIVNRLHSILETINTLISNHNFDFELIYHVNDLNELLDSFWLIYTKAKS